MIHSFADAETERVFHGIVSKRLPQDMQQVARRKLRMLHNAEGVTDLRQPPGNRLHALGGKRLGQYAIRINARWRICFTWADGAWDVEITDYHG